MLRVSKLEYEEVGETENRPSLHVCLAVLLGRRIVELQCTKACTGHEQEGDVLYVVDVLLASVLKVSSMII